MDFEFVLFILFAFQIKKLARIPSISLKLSICVPVFIFTELSIRKIRIGQQLFNVSFQMNCNFVHIKYFF